MIVFAFIMPFLYVIGLTIFLMYISRKKYSFTTVLPLALISTTLFVFLFTCIFHNISIGFWVTAITSATSIVFVVRDKNRLSFIKNNLLTPGFIVFCLIYIFIFMLNWNKVVPLSSDTSMFWAPHVLTMWLSNNFYTTPSLNIIIHGDYPPAIQLFEVIWSKAAGVYREGLLFMAIQILSFSMILPMLDKLTWHGKGPIKKLFMVIFISSVLIIIPLVFFVSGFYSSLEVDTIIGFIFAYCIYVAVTESRHFSLVGVVKLSVVSTFLCLTKQIAPLLAIIAIIIYLSNLFINYQPKLNLKNKLEQLFVYVNDYFKNWKQHWKTILVILIAILLPIFCNRLWAIQTINYKSPDPGVAIFHINTTDVFKIPSILIGDSGSPAQKTFARGFIKHLLYDPSGLTINNISAISYTQFLILCLGSILVVGLLYKDKLKSKKYYALVTWLLIGWILYCLALYCVFLFGGMKDCEMNNLDVSNRYIRTYLFALLLISLFIMFNKITSGLVGSNKQKSLTISIIIATIFFGVFFSPQSIRDLGVGTNNRNKAELVSYNMTNVTNLFQKINQISSGIVTLPKNILVTSDTYYTSHYVQYKALPNRASLVLEAQIKQKKICTIIKHYNYIIVNYYYSDAEWSNINSCLDHKVNFTANTVYQIRINGDGKIHLFTL